MLRKETIDEIDNETEKESLRKIEAVLFVSGRFLSMQDLISFSDLNPITIREMIVQLKKKYEENDSAMQIIQKGVENQAVWKMDVRPEYSNIVNKLASGSSEFSKAEQETLAIITVKQPIKQSVLIRIRGNKAYDHIKKFYDLNLIKKKRSGHTYELTLSDDFYNYFNVSENDITNKEV